MGVAIYLPFLYIFSKRSELESAIGGTWELSQSLRNDIRPDARILKSQRFLQKVLKLCLFRIIIDYKLFSVSCCKIGFIG